MQVHELFDRCANAYDQDRPKLVPDFEAFYGTALRVIPFSPEEQIRILDLGAGTGLFAAMLLEIYREAILHLTDLSEAMLAQARIRFGANPRVSYSMQDHLDLDAADEYDLVVSALSIHHLPDQAKELLFRRIFKALRPGGMFINADQALAPTERGERQYQSLWRKEVSASGISDLALRQALERVRADQNAPLSDQIRWLSEAGFSDIDCWYKRFRFVVYGGFK